MPSSSTTTIASTRQACDRCRGLKLRCTRTDDNGPCGRCRRKGSRCNYSASLPKGRRRNLTNDGITGYGEDMGLNETANEDANAMDLTISSIDAGSPSQSITMESDCFTLDDLVGELGSSKSIDWLPSVNAGLYDQSSCNFDLFTGCQDQNANKHIHRSGSSFSTTRSGNSLDSRTDSIGDSKKDEPEILIAQLAQLSTLISQLRRSGDDLIRDSVSPSLPKHLQSEADPQVRPVGDAIFQSVVAWLARGPIEAEPAYCSSHSCRSQAPKITTLADLLHHIFSASHRFVELIRPLPICTASPTAAPAAHPGSDFTADFPEFIPSTLHWDNSTSLGSFLTYESQSPSLGISSSNTIRHLLIANHTMLLDIFSKMLAVLQRWVTRTVSEGTVPPLLNIRLASVAHTFSYLMDRQNQALELYSLSPTGFISQSEAAVDSMKTESTKVLMAEVKQQILCLQQMVPIWVLYATFGTSTTKFKLYTPEPDHLLKLIIQLKISLTVPSFSSNRSQMTCT